MPLTEIKRDIEKEAEKEAARIRGEANAEKDKILKEASERANRIKEENDKETKIELEKQEQEYSANVDLSLKKVYLDAREDALNSELKGIKEELAEGIRENPAVYKSIFSNAIKEASTMAPLRDLTAITSKEDAKFIDKDGPRIEYQDIDGGLIVISKDKNVRIDATLQRLIESRNDEIKSAILDAIFPESKISRKKETAPKSKNTQEKKQRKKASKPKKAKPKKGKK